MPFAPAALLSGTLFFAGLVSLIRRSACQQRPAAALLMFNGALLLCVASAARLSPHGQAMALVLLGLAPVVLVLGHWVSRKP